MQNSLPGPTLRLNTAFSAVELQDAFQSQQTYLSSTPSLATLPWQKSSVRFSSVQLYPWLPSPLNYSGVSGQRLSNLNFQMY